MEELHLSLALRCTRAQARSAIREAHRVGAPRGRAGRGSRRRSRGAAGPVGGSPRHCCPTAAPAARPSPAPDARRCARRARGSHVGVGADGPGHGTGRRPPRGSEARAAAVRRRPQTRPPSPPPHAHLGVLLTSGTCDRFYRFAPTVERYVDNPEGGLTWGDCVSRASRAGTCQSPAAALRGGPPPVSSSDATLQGTSPMGDDLSGSRVRASRPAPPSSPHRSWCPGHGRCAPPCRPGA